MTDSSRRADGEATSRLPLERRRAGETGTAERLALNRTGSFEWDLDARTVDVDEAGLMVFGLDSATFEASPSALIDRLDATDRARTEATIDEAMAGGSNSYSVHFQVPLEDGTHQWTHVQARILRSEDGRAHRVIGVVRDATAEVTHSAFVLDLEKRRRRQASIVERTTAAMSRAVTVDDVTAALTGPGGLVGVGADGLALGLVENSTLRLIALSGDSVEVLEGLGSGQLDATLPLGDTILSGRPRFITSLGALVRRYPVLEPHIGELQFRAVAYLPLIAQARSMGGLALFYRERTAFSADERILCLGTAAIVAQSLQRAILFDEEREFATGLQSAMLPRRIQEIEGARSRSATTPRGAGARSAATGTT